MDYIDNTLMSSGIITKASIVGIAKNKEWAASKDFEVTHEEAVQILNGFVDPTDIRANGIHLDEKDYVCIRSDSDLLIGRIAGGGCIIGKCKKVMIVALFDDPFQTNCCNLVCKVATYLKNMCF